MRPLGAPRLAHVAVANGRDEAAGRRVGLVAARATDEEAVVESAVVLASWHKNAARGVSDGVAQLERHRLQQQRVKAQTHVCLVRSAALGLVASDGREAVLARTPLLVRVAVHVPPHRPVSRVRVGLGAHSLGQAEGDDPQAECMADRRSFLRLRSREHARGQGAGAWRWMGGCSLTCASRSSSMWATTKTSASQGVCKEGKRESEQSASNSRSSSRQQRAAGAAADASSI